MHPPEASLGVTQYGAALSGLPDRPSHRRARPAALRWVAAQPDPEEGAGNSAPQEGQDTSGYVVEWQLLPLDESPAHKAEALPGDSWGVLPGLVD
ncbi:MAG: hypothetical protein NVSMB32_04170 [Actinomycetota bacterium]